MAAKPITTQSCASVEAFLNAVFAPPKPVGNRCFRGQENAAGHPLPSILRGMKPEAESGVIAELMLESPGDFADDRLQRFAFDRVQPIKCNTQHS